MPEGSQGSQNPTFSQLNLCFADLRPTSARMIGSKPPLKIDKPETDTRHLPNSGHGHQPELVAREHSDAQRKAQIIEWRRQARSFRWIAEKLGISHQRVQEIYSAALKEVVVPAVEQLRQEAMDRYEGHIVELRALVAAEATKDQVDVNAIRQLVDTMMKAQEGIRKLYGLDAPAKVEATVQATVEYRVVGVDAEDMR